MPSKTTHLTEDQLVEGLSSPEASAPNSLNVSRETSPVPHLRDEHGNDPSDRLSSLGPNQRLEVTADGGVIENPDRRQRGKPSKDEKQPHFQPRDEASTRQDMPPSRPQSRSALRGGGPARPDLSVRWPSYIRNQETSPTVPDDPTVETRRNAKRLVRKHTGRPPVPSPRNSFENDAASGSAVSLTSASSRPAKPRRMSRRSTGGESDHSSEWESGGEEDVPVKGRGVLSELLSLYRRDRRDRDQGVFKSLLSSSDEYQRRRWSEKSLYDTEDGGSRRGSANSVLSGMSASDDEEDWHNNSTRVRRNRRRQHMPHRSQDLNEPYIPSPKSSHPISPSTNVGVMQRIYDFLGRHGGPATWFGSPSAANQDRQGGEGEYRNLVALVITTSSLASVASPVLSRFAPASGPGAETNSGQRKLSYYENVNERRAKMREEEEHDDQHNGPDQGNMEDLQRVMEEGRVRGIQKGGRRRGKRRQREMAVTRHIASVIQRKLFIEMLAKSVVNYGAPAHSVESWLSSTADILQIDVSVIFLPGVLIIAFRDTDVHSTDVLFIKPRGGLELYRLSLLHQVYRKVVRDEISATQGCRVIRRIERQTIPYPVVVLILVAAVASGTAARVAFAGSFVDILMAGVLGSFLAIIQFAIAGRHQLLSNIFEIGVAGVLSFLARGLGSTGYFCYQSLVSAAIVLILPGWHICLGALELGSKNTLAGGIRIVWAIVYTLFLSFGLSIGSQIWDAFGPEQPGPSDDQPDTITVQGSFTGNDTTWNQALANGTFSFTNGSSTSSQTSVACYRDPQYNHWWYIETSDWWLFLLVPLFAASLGVWFRADYRSRDLLVMVVVASAGFVVSFFLKTQISQSNVTSAVAAFTVGLLGNLYSRLGGGSAFPSMVVGILLQVPNAIAAAGGLNASDSDDSNQQGINAAVVISIRMVQVGIGLAIGLFAAALVVYPFGKRGRYIFSY